MMKLMLAEYELHYWPFLQGRGEYVRLVLEDAGVPYEDVARQGEQRQAIEQLARRLHGADPEFQSFAPPILVVREAGQRRVIGQMPSICQFLGERHGLAPDEPLNRAQCLAAALCVSDASAEAHNTHHPLSGKLTYEEQTGEARRAGQVYVSQRLGEWLNYFERLLERGNGFCAGSTHSYADLMLFQLLAGLEFAFPNSFAKKTASTPMLSALRERVEARPNVQVYLRSSRRIPFNQHGVFRHYPELDQ